MKRVILVLTGCIINLFILQAQVPESFKYQSVIRNTDGEILVDQDVNLMIEILQGQIEGNIVCSETHYLTTNAFGLVTLEVGSKDSTDFKSINWADGPYFLRVSMDGNVMGTTELLSVPYALYAKSSGDPEYWQPQPGGIYYNEGNIGIGTAEPENTAALEIFSSSKGFLAPRMTSDEIIHIQNPANGLVVFCTTNSKFYAFISEDGVWKDLAFGYSTIYPQVNCGYTLTVEHEAGAVAPVTKSVTYSTVNNVPGEPSKCWLTSNLGADHQASAVDDATEASAGWYWQFNRMQGYMHDGTNRTPNIAWLGLIDEDSDWLPENDPCVLEIGNGWRMPTQSEWVNVNDAGGWYNWYGPWESLLKMHAAGYLKNTDGTLEYRGIQGNYWSDLAGSSTTAWYERFRDTLCGYAGNFKSYGFSVRCINDGN